VNEATEIAQRYRCVECIDDGNCNTAPNFYCSNGYCSTGVPWYEDGEGDGSADRPALLTSGDGLRIAVDGGFAYWVSYKGIFRVATAGGTATRVVPFERYSDAKCLGVDATNVHWVNYEGSLLEVGVAGGTPRTIAAFDGVNSCAFSSGYGYLASGLDVLRVSLIDGTTAQLNDDAEYETSWVAASASRVAWLRRSAQYEWDLVLKTGGATPTVIPVSNDTSDGSNWWGVTLASNSAYWGDSNQIFALVDGFAAAPIVQLSSDYGGATGAQGTLIADDRRVYWVWDGYIWSTPLATGNPQPRSADILSKRISDARFLALDTGYVYFTTTSGFIGRIRKP
jgi:hypothetical protein